MVDRSEIERIAELARLKLADDEIAGLTDDFAMILQYFESIVHLDPGDKEAASGTGQPTPAREDQADSRPLALSPEEMAAVWREGYFVLPRLPAMDP